MECFFVVESEEGSNLTQPVHWSSDTFDSEAFLFRPQSKKHWRDSGMKQEISFTVTSIAVTERRKKEGVEEVSKLTLNSENEEKCVIIAPEGGEWSDVNPGDIVKLRLAVRQKTLEEQRAEEEEVEKSGNAKEEKKKQEAEA